MLDDSTKSDPNALTDYAEDAGWIDAAPELVTRRRFLAIAEALGGTAALGTLAGCTGGSGGGGGSPTATQTKTEASKTATQTKSTPTTSKPANLETVKLAYVPAGASAPIWVADHFGIFADKGIKIKATTSVSGSKATAQLATGQLDIVSGAIGASTFNALANDIPIELSADLASSTPGLPIGNRYWIKKELYTDGMTMDDIKGPVTVGENAPASVGEYELARTLSIHDNLSWDDVNVKFMPFPQMISGMASGAIDIAHQIDPLGPIMGQKLGAKFLEYSNRPTPQLQVAGLIVGGPFKNQRPDIAQKFHEAYILGIRKYYEMGGPENDTIAKVVADQLGNPVSSIKTSIPYFHNKNGLLWEDNIMDQQDYMACQGYIKTKVAKKDIFANDLMNAALDVVGAVPKSEERVGKKVFDEWKSNSPNPSDWPPLASQRLPAKFPNDKVCGHPLT